MYSVSPLIIMIHNTTDTIYTNLIYAIAWWARLVHLTKTMSSFNDSFFYLSFLRWSGCTFETCDLNQNAVALSYIFASFSTSPRVLYRSNTKLEMLLALCQRYQW